MPARLLALLLLAGAVAGCTRAQSRDRASARHPLPSPYASRVPVGTPQGRSPLAMTGSPPAGPASRTPTELNLVPPPPREMATGAEVNPPTGPKPPNVPAAGGGVVPAAAESVPAAGRLSKDPRPEPQASDLPPPFARGATPTGPVSGNLAQLKRLSALATRKWQSVDTYETRSVRREVVNGKPPKTEEMLIQFRREPFAVYMRNVGETGRGREILYAPSKTDDKLHVVVGEGDTVFLKAGTRAPSQDPDSARVRSASRHSIKETGFGTPIAGFAKAVSRIETARAAADSLKYAGAVTRQELPGATLEAVDQTLAPGDDPLLPKGGRRQWFFDAKPESPSYGLPVMLITFEGNREVEFYSFDRFRLPAGLTDADFSPDRLGQKK